MKIVRIFKVIVGLLMGSFGFLLLIGSVIGLIDPVGSQMANDNDPYGTPPSAWESVLRCVISAGVGVGGVLLLRGKKAK